VAEAGSIARASRNLFISQPALSVQIKRLERDLGIELLQRSRAGVSLTQTGENVYAVARGVLQQTEAAERRLNELRSGVTSPVNVATSNSGALYFLVDAIRAFRNESPSISVNILVQGPQQNVEQMSLGLLDFEIAWERSLPEALVFTPLLEVDFGIIASPDHHVAEPGRISTLEFSQTPFISMHPGLAVPSIEETWMREHRMQPRALTRQMSIDAVKRLVEADLGIAILSRLAVRRELSAGTLVWLGMEGFELHRRVLLVRSPKPPSGSASEFMTYIKAYAEQLQMELIPSGA
jgi:DNA-binding transcriptional LysR family regulator